MHPSSFTLRPATSRDCERLLDWANDPESRAASFRSEPIPETAHRIWFNEALAGARTLFIIELDGDAVGVARLDPITATRAEVSLTIAPEHRCCGVGTSALQALAQSASAAGVSELSARIRCTNVHSQRTFERAGFEQVGEEDVNGIRAVCYRLSQT